MPDSRREESTGGFYLVNGALGALIFSVGLAEEGLASKVIGGMVMTPAVVYYSALLGEEVHEAIVRYEKIRRAKNIMHIRDCRRDS
jgi:heme A synthase